jgi:hypothetical protein
VDAVLVGEALIRTENPIAFIANLFNLPPRLEGDANTTTVDKDSG